MLMHSLLLVGAERHPDKVAFHWRSPAPPELCRGCRPDGRHGRGPAFTWRRT